MFAINRKSARSIAMKTALNSILGDIWEECNITQDVALMRQHRHRIVAVYEGQEVEVSVPHIDMGVWKVDGGTDTAKCRILDALGTIA